VRGKRRRSGHNCAGGDIPGDHETQTDDHDGSIHHDVVIVDHDDDDPT
jgi:hypothetical protein